MSMRPPWSRPNHLGRGEVTEKLRQDQPLGWFNGLGTYFNGSHLAIADIGDAGAKSETLGAFWSSFMATTQLEGKMMHAGASVVSVTAPLFALILFFQHRMLSGLTAGAMPRCARCPKSSTGHEIGSIKPRPAKRAVSGAARQYVERGQGDWHQPHAADQ